MIDDLSYTVSQLKYGNSAKEQEGKDILSELELLKKSVVCNDQLTPLSDDGEADIVLYNEELRKLGSPTWQDIPWLFCECYMYSTFFTLSTYWKTYDVFANQKTETFRSSLPAVLELAAHSQRWVTQVARGMPESLHGILFNEVFEICLWGNATDLSLLTNLTYEEIQRLQGSEARKRAENNILVNDLGAVYANLNRAKAERAERRVDIVLDNAGFELFVDLLLAEYLLSAGLATTVVLHAKSIPWFVSDVTAPDFEVLFSALQDPQSFFSTSQGSDTPSALSDENRANIARLSRSWSGHLAVGALVVRPSRFWTHPGSFWRMRDEARDLCRLFGRPPPRLLAPWVHLGLHLA
ncbi:hypothetical protein DL769_008431 [Monosporascus sp. CRB-8-3]|nr:hypothetical protein DL769_008431 [Monosporascus sp. CRB-8-3]